MSVVIESSNMFSREELEGPPPPPPNRDVSTWFGETNESKQRTLNWQKLMFAREAYWMGKRVSANE